MSTDTKLGQQVKDSVKDTAITTRDAASGAAMLVADKAVETKDKMVSTADSAWHSVSNAGGALGHSAAEKSHKVAESYNRTLATSAAIDSKDRMEAAKSALEHHEAAKEHGFIKEQEMQQSGLDNLSAKASDYATAAKDTAIVASAVIAQKTAPALDAIKEKSSGAASYVQQKTAPVVDSMRESASNTAAYIRTTAEQGVRNTTNTIWVKTDETGSYAEQKWHEVSEKFKEAVESTARIIQSNANHVAAVIGPKVEMIKDTTMEISENISIGAQSAWYAVAAFSAAAGHAAAENTHLLAESYNARIAISEASDSKTRMLAAKAALEHHAAAKHHHKYKELNQVAAGIPEMKRNTIETAKALPDKVSNTIHAIPPALSSAASTASQYAYAAEEYVASGASAVYHRTSALGVDQRKRDMLVQEEIAKEKAINTGLPVTERMDAAKTALEHNLPERPAQMATTGPATTQ